MNGAMDTGKSMKNIATKDIMDTSQSFSKMVEDGNESLDFSKGDPRKPSYNSE